MAAKGKKMARNSYTSSRPPHNGWVNEHFGWLMVTLLIDCVHLFHLNGRFDYIYILVEMYMCVCVREIPSMKRQIS